MPIFPPLPGRIDPDSQVSPLDSSGPNPLLEGDNPLGDPRLLPATGLIPSEMPQPLPRRAMNEEPRFPLQVLPNGRIDESQLRLGNIYVAPDGTGWRWQGRRFVSTGATRRSLSTTQISKRITGQGPAAVRIGVDEMQNRADLFGEQSVPAEALTEMSATNLVSELDEGLPNPEVETPLDDPLADAAKPKNAPSNKGGGGWIPTMRVNNGERKQVDTGREFRVDLGTLTLGLDGFRATVDWHPLRSDGTLETIVRSADHRPREIVFQGTVFNTTTHILSTRFDNPHGFRWTIAIPPQAATNANSLGHFVDVFVRN